MIRICTQEGFAYQTARQWLIRYRGKKPRFACVLSFTKTCLQPQISAAGADPDARRIVALADGTYLHSGPRHQPPLPPLSAGVSPAILSRAMLSHCQIPIQLFSTGLPAALAVPHVPIANAIAQDLSTGAALTAQQAAQLFSSGYQQGQQLAASTPDSYWILGESVVGGTTTAQAVLAALGYPVAGKVSSSHLRSNHAQKQALVRQGIQRWQARDRQHQTPAQPFQKNSSPPPMAAAAALGDPMQLAVAGMTLAISQSSGVLLAGGAQMLAVYALTRAIAQAKGLPWNAQQVVVGTTRWVIEDSSADTVAIAQAIQAPYLASQLSFAQSPYVQLRAYERGFVKEGTGAGGCAIAARLYKNATNAQLRHAIEAELRHAL